MTPLLSTTSDATRKAAPPQIQACKQSGSFIKQTRKTNSKHDAAVEHCQRSDQQAQVQACTTTSTTVEQHLSSFKVRVSPDHVIF